MNQQSPISTSAKFTNIVRNPSVPSDCSSVMATSYKEMQSTDCPVCFEKYSDPKILPCGHLLCRDCLLKLMKKKRKALCPMCRFDIVDPQNSNIKILDVFVDSLPTDYAMCAMVESLKILTENPMCHVHNYVDAISLCLSCNVKMCQDCIKVHRALPKTSFHKTEVLATLTPERLAASRQTPCSVHPDKTANLICADHKVLICTSCARANHRACSEVTHVSDVSGTYQQSLLEMENKLSTAESSLSKAITELEENLLKTEENTNVALEEIDKTCDRLLMSVQNCRERLKKLVTDKKDTMKVVFDEQKYLISHKSVRVTSHQGLIKRTLQIANDSSIVAMVTNLESRVNDLSTCLPQDIHSCLTVTLKIDSKWGSKSLVKNELNKIITPIFRFSTGKEKNTWMFHNNSGSNIVLSNNGQTAEVKDNNVRTNRVLISTEPMSTNRLYEILVEEADIRSDGANTFVGVCEENPLSITRPIICSEVKTFIGVHAFGGMNHCQVDHGISCPALKTVKVGSRLGVMVDTSHSLHVYVDGKDQGVMAKNVARPCYAMFDIRYFIKKVSTLPVSSIE